VTGAVSTDADANKKNRDVTRPGATTVTDAVAECVCPNIMNMMNREWMLPLLLSVGPKTL
jgi:hypothetical protein